MDRAIFTLVDSKGNFAVPKNKSGKAIPVFLTQNRALVSMKYYQASDGRELYVAMYTRMVQFTNTTSLTGK